MKQFHYLAKHNPHHTYSIEHMKHKVTQIAVKQISLDEVKQVTYTIITINSWKTNTAQSGHNG